MTTTCVTATRVTPTPPATTRAHRFVETPRMTRTAETVCTPSRTIISPCPPGAGRPSRVSAKCADQMRIAVVTAPSSMRWTMR